MLTQEKLKNLFEYDPETGSFIRKESVSNTHQGMVAGHTNKITGYCKISIENEKHYAHRLAFLYMTGKMPEHSVDHINGNPSDNRWTNLREATHRQNLQNQKKRNTNSSGYTGVSYHKKADKW
jgi:hypothetical protein